MSEPVATMSNLALDLVDIAGEYTCCDCGKVIHYSCSVIPELANASFFKPHRCDDCADILIEKRNRIASLEILQQRQQDAGIDAGLQKWIPEKGNNALLTKVMELARNDVGIFIVGEQGSGKTTTTCEAVRWSMQRHENAKVKYIFYPELAAQIATGADGQRRTNFIISSCLDADILFLDDLANRAIISDAVGSVLVRIADTFYRSGGQKKLFITSNDGEAGLRQRFENPDDCKRFVGRIKRMIKAGDMMQMIVPRITSSPQQ